MPIVGTSHYIRREERKGAEAQDGSSSSRFLDENSRWKISHGVVWCSNKERLSLFVVGEP